MDKKTKILFVIFILLIASMVYFESVKRKPISWFPSYSASHKIPLGTYVLRNSLTDLFPNSSIKDVKIPPFLFLKDSLKTGTYVFINEKINFGDDEFFKLMQFVEKGNTVFISTHGAVIDTLNIETNRLVTTAFNEEPFFKLVNPVFKNKEITFDRDFSNQVFTEIDTLKTTVLGITGYLNSDKERVEEGVNFIKVSFGKGLFYLHTFPEAFTNYSILNPANEQYAANVLSYLNDGDTIYYDEYYKTGRAKITSKMQYILNSKYLKWAYYTALIGIFLFVVFEGKRKQRIVPITIPLKNQTLAFTRTIADMYYDKQNHKDIAEHQINYLLEYVRNKLKIPTSEINEIFYQFVASRKNMDVVMVRKLFNYCETIHQKNTITKEELFQLNTMIEQFKKQ